jgi:hypothetical protein
MFLVPAEPCWQPHTHNCTAVSESFAPNTALPALCSPANSSRGSESISVEPHLNSMLILCLTDFFEVTLSGVVWSP